MGRPAFLLLETQLLCATALVSCSRRKAPSTLVSARTGRQQDPAQAYMLYYYGAERASVDIQRPRQPCTSSVEVSCPAVDCKKALTCDVGMYSTRMHARSNALLTDRVGTSACSCKPERF